MRSSDKNAGAHVEAMDAANVCALFNALDGQYQIDLRVAWRTVRSHASALLCVDRNVQIANCVSQLGASLPLSRLLAYVLAAGGPPDQLANVRWPLHKALRELLEATGRSGERDLIGVIVPLRCRPQRDRRRLHAAKAATGTCLIPLG